MKFGKLLKGLGKKAGGLGKRIKGAVRHAPRAGYSRAGQKGLLGGTTKSAASRALAPVKAKARAMGSKIRSTASKAATRVKGTHGADTKSGFAGRKEDFVGGQESFADFDSLNSTKAAPTMRTSNSKSLSRKYGSKMNAVKNKANSVMNAAKTRASSFRNTKSGFAGLKSNGSTRYEIL